VAALQLLDYLMPLLPLDRPNHLLGIGDVESIRCTLCAVPACA
jgi:queuine/archaeosine tRNA-ribosyltransferase